MFNFLPAKYGKVVKREHVLRSLVVIFVLLSFVAIVSALLAASAYFAARDHFSVATEEESSVRKTLESGEQMGVSGVVSKVNAYITAATSLSPLSPEMIVEPIISALPSGVTVSAISLGETDAGIKATVTGTSVTRDELLTFEENLEGVARFSVVDLPVSSLAKDTNINYSITISVNVVKAKQQ